MTQQVEDENGHIHEFPDDATPDEMNASLDNHQDQIKNNFNPSFGEKLAPNIVAGLAEMGHGLLNTPSNVANYLASKNIIKPESAKKIPRQKDYDYAELLKLPPATLSDKLVRGLAQYAPAFAFPEAELGSAGKALSSIPYAGRLLKKSIANSLPISAFAATQNPDNAEESAISAGEATLPFSAASTLATTMNPWARLAGRVGLGAAGSYGGYKGAEALGAGKVTEIPAAIAGGALSMIGRNPEMLARESMLKGVSETPYKEKLEAANRLGLSYLTPAEASGNPFVAAQQGAAGKTEEGSQLLYNRGKERLASENKAINKLFDTIYKKEKLDPQVKSLYKESYQKSVPQDFVEDLKKNEIFNDAVKNLENKSAFKESLKDIPENSIGYLDHVKQSLDDMIEKAPKKEARILQQTRSSLVSKLDEIAPEYQQARSLAERGIARSKLEEALNKKDIRGTNFFNKVLKNDKTFNKTRFSLRNIPDAQQQLDDMRKVFGDLINPPTVRTAAGLAKTSMTKERSSLQYLEDAIKEKMTKGKYDKAAIELITNPKWADELHKAATAGKFRQGLSSFIDLLGRAAGAKAAQGSQTGEANGS